MAQARPALLHAQPRSPHALVDRVRHILDARLSEAAHGAVRPQVMRMRSSSMLAGRCAGWEARACDGPPHSMRLWSSGSGPLVIMCAQIPLSASQSGGLDAVSPAIKQHLPVNVWPPVCDSNRCPGFLWLKTALDLTTLRIGLHPR